MEQMFLRMRFGQKELFPPKADNKPVDLNWLNKGLEGYLKQGWRVKDFEVVGGSRPVFVILMEK